MPDHDHSRDAADLNTSHDWDDFLDDLDIGDASPHEAGSPHGGRETTRCASVPAPRPIIAVCAEHLERALEEYVDDYLRAPDVYLADDPELAAATGGRGIPADCQYCRAPAKYVVF